MEDKQKSHKLLVVLITILIVLLGVGTIAGIWYWQVLEKKMDNKTPNTIQTKEDAINQAKEYRPEEGCIAVLTPAIHKATGAKYTFGSGCLPPGWEREEGTINNAVDVTAINSSYRMVYAIGHDDFLLRTQINDGKVVEPKKASGFVGTEEEYHASYGPQYFILDLGTNNKKKISLDEVNSLTLNIQDESPDGVIVIKNSIESYGGAPGGLSLKNAYLVKENEKMFFEELRIPTVDLKIIGWLKK